VYVLYYIGVSTLTCIRIEMVRFVFMFLMKLWGRLVGGFLVFCPPIFRVEISGSFSRKIGGLNRDFSIPRFMVL